jgi:hypothetical protein
VDCGDGSQRSYLASIWDVADLPAPLLWQCSVGVRGPWSVGERSLSSPCIADSSLVLVAREERKSEPLGTSAREEATESEAANDPDHTE